MTQFQEKAQAERPYFTGHFWLLPGVQMYKGSGLAFKIKDTE